MSKITAGIETEIFNNCNLKNNSSFFFPFIPCLDASKTTDLTPLYKLNLQASKDENQSKRGKCHPLHTQEQCNAYQ